MRYRNIGRTDLQASVIGLGCWAIGGGSWWGETDDAESIRAIHAALDAGITLVDTAPVYGWGRSEEVVGRALADRRDEVVLSSKCGLVWGGQCGAPFFELDGYDVRRCLRPECIRHELEVSLKRLGTDRIDLYHTHWQAIEPDPTPIADTMACLLELKAEGKIRAIAASNVSIPEMREYLAVGPLDAIQERYSLLDRRLEDGRLPFAAQHEISLLAYSPLEQGLLTGRIGMDRQFGPGEYRSELPWMQPENRRRVLELLAGWHDLLEHYDCTMTQLVLAWTLQQPGLTYTLVGARHAEQVAENAAAGDLELAPADLARMRTDVEALGEPA